MKLIVSETFYSLQCEGREIGVPAVFLRLAGCNLLCNSPSWRCDTIEVWQKGHAKFFADVLSEEFIQRLRDGAHLVITGGEPLLHQGTVIQYLEYLRTAWGCNPIVEMETNGTIVPAAQLYNHVSRWNVCPKLTNCGEPVNKRLNELALVHFNNHPDTIFKFVISKPEDVLEILQDYAAHISMNKVVLMPAGATREELDAVRLMVVEQALKIGVRYSERLHIVIWNKKTGV